MIIAQAWCFLAPELTQAIVPEHGGSDSKSWYTFKISDMLFDAKHRFNVWSFLAQPVTPPQTSTIVVGSLGAFDVLSNEIIQMIIDNIGDKSDVIALGLSCEGFWQIIVRHIHHSYMRAAAPWAGTKMCFIGSLYYELPAPFIEEGLFEKFVTEEALGNDMRRHRRFVRLVEKLDNPVGPFEVASKWNEAARHHQENGIEVSAARWNNMRSEIGCDHLFPKDHLWVLRNLTTRETVHSGPPLMRTLRSGKNKSGLKFEDVLMMGICWTHCPPWRDEELDLYRGVWAGHCFDIVTSEVHSREENEADWKDVTGSIAMDLALLRRKLRR